ncbi:hypothetical protein FHW12_004243 [Dokdonella fugitiva]|uniref:Uncharacterized protein n=1 Tax=Dokdonella fugitiva TaxID=328517 RepID=A0A839F5Y0_9GAMM|nr:hypothetical protein [Dokdonella fugitiva]MBA8889996.1 hypothetical protein [Dokdonella fugitiva]
MATTNDAPTRGRSSVLQEIGANAADDGVVLAQESNDTTASAAAGRERGSGMIFPLYGRRAMRAPASRLFRSRVIGQRA